MKAAVKMLIERDKDDDRADARPLMSDSNSCSPAPTPTPPPLTQDNDTPTTSPSAVIVEEPPSSNGTSDGTELAVPQPSPLAQSQGRVTVVVQEPTPAGGPKFRDTPLVMVDSDGVPFTTELRYVNGLFTWIVVGVSCVVSGWCCCPCLGLIPLCIKQLKDIEHINPETRRVVGKFDRVASFGL